MKRTTKMLLVVAIALSAFALTACGVRESIGIPMGTDTAYVSYSSDNKVMSVDGYLVKVVSWSQSGLIHSGIVVLTTPSNEVTPTVMVNNKSYQPIAGGLIENHVEKGYLYEASPSDDVRNFKILPPIK